MVTVPDYSGIQNSAYRFTWLVFYHPVNTREQGEGGKKMNASIGGFGEVNPLKDLKRQEEYEKQQRLNKAHEECQHDFEGIRYATDEDAPGSGYYRCKKCGYIMD
jgi:rubrerythrin